MATTSLQANPGQTYQTRGGRSVADSSGLIANVSLGDVLDLVSAGATLIAAATGSDGAERRSDGGEHRADWVDGTVKSHASRILMAKSSISLIRSGVRKYPVGLPAGAYEPARRRD
jgi:hypothetical protein